ncbi:hypothetical protein Y024_5455 [Burkholderia pseudomallei TSV44]|uniref:hypothetical protein n=1 Tax=Burkholderia pseudomallei TaxID=28450 RepID=UPI0005376533|nr:hypothetical protein [Burkholderia pseudomallei]KGX52772.1 hypothetical protein Y024_5455 [Burkholderia pseudomallei TSV44]
MGKVNLSEIHAAISTDNNDFISFAEVLDKLVKSEDWPYSEAALILQKSGVCNQNMATRNQMGIVTPTTDFEGLSNLLRQAIEWPGTWVSLNNGQQAHAEGYGWIRSKFVNALKDVGLSASGVDALTRQGNYTPIREWAETYDDPALLAEIESLQAENKKLKAELTVLKARIDLPDSDRMPEELDMCLTVWAAAEQKWSPSGGSTPKKVIEEVINNFYTNLPKNVKDRISAVCNWDKGAGRKNYE